MGDHRQLKCASFIKKKVVSAFMKAYMCKVSTDFPFQLGGLQQVNHIKEHMHARID